MNKSEQTGDAPTAGCCLCAALGDAAGDTTSGPRLTRRETLRGVLAASAGSALLGGGSTSAATTADAGAVGFAPEAGALLEVGAALLEVDGELQVQRDVRVLVRDGVIEAVRTGPLRVDVPRFPMPEVLLLPGFISGHTHCCSATPTRGIIESPRSYRRPLELVEALSDSELDALTAFNLAELLRSGCTTQLEMSLSLRQAESYVRVAERWGVRGYPGAMIPDMTRLFPIWFRDSDDMLRAAEPETLAEIERNLDFCRRHMARGDGRILPMLSPHACDTHTPATMQAMARGVSELGTGLHIHLSQGGRETETVRRLWGVTPTQWLEQLGFFNAGPVFGAHMTGLDWQVDAPILARHGAVYAHCPSAGGAGGDTQPYPEALAAGIPVNIAIDTHSNDYLENLKLAVLYGQARHALRRELAPGSQASRAPTVLDAVDGATRIAARGLRREDLGVIRPGARADLVAVDVSGPLVGAGALPPEPLNNLLYANGRMVRMVMTDGRVQVHDGHFVADDERRIVAEGGEVVRGLWARLEREGWFEPATA